MKLKVFFLFIFTTMIVSGLKSQNADLYLLKMKSGLVIKCEVLKIVPDSFVKIRQYNFESTIKMSDIQTIEFSEINGAVFTPFNQTNAKVKAPRAQIADSFWHLGLSVGFSAGNSSYDITTNFLTRINVLRSNRKRTRWMYGPYLALEPYSYYGAVAFTPGLEGRYHFNKSTPKSGIIYGYTGYTMNINTSKPLKNDGSTFGFGIGKSSRTQNGNIFTMMFGYKYQTIQSQINVFDNFRREWINVDATHILPRFEARVEWRF